MKEVNSVSVAIEVAPRLKEGVTVEDVFVGWVQRAQRAPLMKPRGDSYVNVRVPLVELQAVCAALEESRAEDMGQVTLAVQRADFDPLIQPQPLRRPRKPKASA